MIRSEFSNIITSSYGRDIGDSTIMESIFKMYRILIIAYRPRYIPASKTHPTHIGHETGLLVKIVDLIVVIDGDGSFKFGNLTPAHFICNTLNLPILIAILDNFMRGAV